MKPLDGTALINVPKILGVPQPDSRERIEFDDLIIQQHLDITGIAGRGRTKELGARGIVGIRLSNSHTAAELITSTFDPYDPAFVTTPGVPWFPADQVALFDIYLLGPISGISTVANAFESGVVDITHPVSLNDATAGAPQRVAFFTDDQLLPLIGSFFVEAGTGKLQVDVQAHRLVPGAGIRWTTTSVATAIFRVNMALLVTAIGIPQDAR